MRILLELGSDPSIKDGKVRAGPSPITPHTLIDVS